MAFTRDEIIKYGVDRGYNASTINKVLHSNGHGDYNPFTSGYNILHTIKETPKSLINLGKDALTFGGMVAKPVLDIVDSSITAPIGEKINTLKSGVTNLVSTPTFQNMVKGAGAGLVAGKVIPKVGPIAGMLTGGVVGAFGPKQTSDSMLSTYGLNTDKVVDMYKNGATKEQLLDIAQRGMYDPAYAGLDFLSLGGAKALGNLGKLAGNSMPANAPMWIQQIIPSKEVRDLNRYIQNSTATAKASVGKNYNAYGILESKPNVDRAELVRHITTGTSKLKGKDLTLANGIRDALVSNEQTARELGLLDNELAKADVVAQYVMQKVPREYNLLHKHFRDIYLGKGLDARAAKILKEKGIADDITRLIKEGSDLYDQKKIAYLTQKLASTTDPMGEIIARELNIGANNYWDTARHIGRTTPEELAKVFDESIKFQLDQTSHIKQFNTILDDLFKNTNIVKGLSPEVIKSIRDKATKVLKDDFEKGLMPDLNKALRESGLDRYVNRIYFEALNNVFKKPLNVGMRRVLNQFKKNVLATPHWVALNRAGNITNNIMEGVGLIDYLDIKKYKNYIPDQLKQQTSFSSYLNEGLESATDSASNVARGKGAVVTVPYNKIKRAIDKYNSGHKSLRDVGELTGELYANINDIAANPVFKLESVLELADRSANYIRQAKRLAKKKGVDVKKILKDAKENPTLFNKLNTEVNKSLGDYVGRQYTLPAGFYNTLSELIPFYRFYTQTMRTTAHQLANKPWNFQGIVQIPNKLGKNERERVERIFNLNPEYYQGGIPYGYTNSGAVNTMGLEQLPVQSVLQLAGKIGEDPREASQLLNPVLSSLAPAISFEKFNKVAKTPRMDMMLKTTGDTKGFKPNAEEWARYVGNAILGSTSSIYNWVQRIIPELSAPFNGGIQSRYDTHPFTAIPGSYNKTYPSETILKQIGVKTNSNYPIKPESKSQMKRKMWKAIWANVNENKGKEKLHRK